jgi:predicted Zn-dependent protease
MTANIDLEWFASLAKPFLGQAKSREFLSFSGQVDQCEFVRLNSARVVQASQVDYISVGIGLRNGTKSVGAGLSLSTDLHQAREQLSEQLARLRSWISHVPDDPFMEQWAPPSQSHTDSQMTSAPVAQVVEDLSSSARGLDLVGLYAAGPLASFMATSDGHFHWHRSLRSFFDFSVYAQKDKAIKGSWSGQAWSGGVVDQKIQDARARLDILFRPPVTLPPGVYRALLSSEAVSDLLGLACWGGFSARAHLTSQSPFAALRSGEKNLSPGFTLEEDLEGFGIPRVQELGHLRPSQTPLISKGRFSNWLCSPRTATEFGVQDNAASGGESPAALRLSAGELDPSEALQALGDGIYLSNVWYLNYSDRQSARFTGMSRFASLLIEGGRPVAPISPMRFDDSFYSVFGKNLLALGREIDRFDEMSTYGARGLGGVAAPCALVQDMNFPL